jgi:raffinose/stachyose/melibiose transport system permease protein
VEGKYMDVSKAAAPAIINRKHMDGKLISFPFSRLFIYLFLTLWAVTTIFPFLWVINCSFKTTTQILNDSFSLSLKPILANYANAFERQNILRSYMNSLLISGSVTGAVVLFSTMAAFAMTRYDFKGKKLLKGLVICSLMFPAFSTIVPEFIMIARMGLMNKPLGVILPQIAGNLSFAIIVMMGFIDTIPRDLEESAFLEGCSAMQIFTRIIMPLSKPSFATVAIFTFLWSYNDLFTQIIIIRDRKTYPISALLNEISSKYGTDYGLMAAAVTLIIIPLLIVYVLLQKNIVKGLTAGAIKG